MLATGAGRDVHKLAGLDEVDPMPDPLGYDQRLAGSDLDIAMTTFELEENLDPPGYEVKQLVAIGMHLTVVGGVAGQVRRSDRVAVKTERTLWT
jgi:hypothetical protein